MEPVLVLDRKEVAQIIAKWWAEHSENPEAFRTGPDSTGEDSADKFFRIAGELGFV